MFVIIAFFVSAIFSPYNQKDLADLYSTDLQGQFLCLGNYSVGWAFCPLTGYFTLPVDKTAIKRSFLR